MHLWSKFGYDWRELLRTGAILKRLTETLTDTRTDARTHGRTDIQNLDRYVSPRTFVQATQKWRRKGKSKQWKFEQNRIFGSRAMNFHSLMNPCHRGSRPDPWVGNAINICDVIVDTSPLVLYTKSHIFPLFMRSEHSFDLILEYVMAAYTLQAVLKNWNDSSFKIS